MGVFVLGVDKAGDLFHDLGMLPVTCRFETVSVRCFQSLLAGVLLFAAMPLQSQTTRSIYVSVSDPLNRFVSGLARDHFTVVENGVTRTVSSVVDADSPIAIAVVGDLAVPAVAGEMGPKDVVIQTKSLEEAVQQLTASTSARKTLIVTTGAELPALAEGIQLLRVEPAMLSRTLIEVRNQYLLRVEGDGSNGGLGVTVRSPRGLPSLQAHPLRSGVLK